MNCTLSKVDGFTVVAIAGEIDLNSSPQMRKAFGELIDKGTTKVIVDLKQVSYIDSSGLATLIEVMQKIKKNRGAMSLVNMSDKIRNLFEITKLDKLFSIYRTQEEALAAV